VPSPDAACIAEISFLKKHTLDDIVNEITGSTLKIWSISVHDEKGEHRASEKPNSVLSDIGVAYQNGSGKDRMARDQTKANSGSQDCCFMLDVPGHFSVYAVFDGHGPYGHEVAIYVKDNLPKLIVRDCLSGSGDCSHTLKACFRKMQLMLGAATAMGLLNAQFSGTTATVAIHNHTKNELTIAHVGDSKACMVGDPPEFDVCHVTSDHRAKLPAERSRIEKAGGVVENGRAYTKWAQVGLCLSRSLGDLAGHAGAGLSSEPEVSNFDIGPEGCMLVVGSDGVWDFVLPHEAVGIVSKFDRSQAMNAAKQLARHASGKWREASKGTYIDDISLIVAYLEASMRPMANDECTSLVSTTTSAHSHNSLTEAI
jgi:serine/threonine protein phosphatase PrpC